MQKAIVCTVLTLIFSMPARAQNPDFNACDSLYAQRGPKLVDAVKCYQAQLSQSSLSGRKALLERIFISLSATVAEAEKTAEERRAIDTGLELIQTMKSDFENTADYHYWRAVFVSFDAIQSDRGGSLPTHLFKVIRLIQSELRLAISLDPTIHHYGPHRVLGTMHTQMPTIVGGDKKLAENLLKMAYDRAPALSANQYAYANILSVNGKYDEMKKVVEHFLSMTDAELDPYPTEPLRLPRAEIESDKKKAKALLEN